MGHYAPVSAVKASSISLRSVLSRTIPRNPVGCPEEPRIGLTETSMLRVIPSETPNLFVKSPVFRPGESLMTMTTSCSLCLVFSLISLRRPPVTPLEIHSFYMKITPSLYPSPSTGEGYREGVVFILRCSRHGHGGYYESIPCFTH